MKRRRRSREGAEPQRPADPLRALFDEFGDRRAPAPQSPPPDVAAPVPRIAERVARLAYARSQAAAALGMSQSTFTRRVLPLIETIEMPWGTKLVPVDELERLVAERRRPARPRSRAATTGRRPVAPAELVSRIVAESQAGKSLSQIARDLNAEAVPTSHGGEQWWPSTVRVVLRGRTASRIVDSTKPPHNA
jgi:Recombinase